MIATLEGDGATFRFRTSEYDRDLKDELKAVVPHSFRTWNKGNRYSGPGYWEVSAQYWDEVIEICERRGVIVKTSGSVESPKERKVTFRLDYIGLIRHRGNEVYTANGWVDDGWNATFTLEVLQDWFGFTVGIGKVNKADLYSVLSVRSGVSGSELKKAWRRAARTWHPDVCQEPDAEEQFMLIQEAYEKLSNPRFRAAYDAGRAFTKDAEDQKSYLDSVRNRSYGGYSRSGRYRQHNSWSEEENEAINWKPPVRCGMVEAMVTGMADKYGNEKYLIAKILSWEDITNSAGETMVTYWPPGNKTFATKWVV